MPSKNKHAAKSQQKKASGRTSKPAKKSGKAAATEGEAHDILGVVLLVFSLVLCVCVLSSSDALVTGFIREGFGRLFGKAALIVPLALLVFSVSYFFGFDFRRRAQLAAGFVIIVWSLCAAISLYCCTESLGTQQLFSHSFLSNAGGYTGSSLAWLLLTLFGKGVGFVILGGLVLIALVICGFSVSTTIESLRSHSQAVLQQRKERRKKTREQKIIDAAAEYGTDRSFGRGRIDDRNPGAEDDDYDDTKTTKIQEGKTALLHKSRSSKSGASAGDFSKSSDSAQTRLFPIEHPDEIDSGGSSPKTTVLSHDLSRKKGTGSKSGAIINASASAGATPAPGSDATPVVKKKASTPVLTRPGDGADNYRLPSMELLRSQDVSGLKPVDDDELKQTARRLQETLEEFDLSSRVEGWTVGPSVTTFKISMGTGERVNKIVNLEDDIALSLAAKSVRIFAPIPGTSLVGIEIPNQHPQSVLLSDVLPYVKGGPLDCAFGRDSEGKPIVVDLAGLPHLLVAGTTGSGKSVMLNAIIMSMLMRSTPEQVRLIMVDPKRVEFTAYAGLPHLYVPVVTEARQAAGALQWAVSEMERRLKVFEHFKVRDINGFLRNIDKGKYDELEEPPQRIPFFVIVIDELADLMLVAGKDVESSIVRIAQLGRAAGIHLIVATQRPSADVVTGLIRANIDNRIALSVDNSLNSRIILDQKGAETLLGKGDMLVKLRGKKPRRAQGCWVSDAEIEAVVKYVKTQSKAEYHEDILTMAVPLSPHGSENGASKGSDPLMWEAARIVVESGFGSTSGIQRALSVGYARAGRIMDILENIGVVGPANGSKPREVLLDADGLEELRSREEAQGGGF